MTDAYCRSCGAHLTWAKRKHSWIALDHDQVGTGDRFIISNDDKAYPTKIGPGHTEHVKTCAARVQTVEQGEMFA